MDVGDFMPKFLEVYQRIEKAKQAIYDLRCPPQERLVRLQKN